MFPTPEFLSVPMFSSLGSGTVLYPTVGAVLAWMLIAGFVGSVLGMLRTGLRAPEGRRESTKLTLLRVALECMRSGTARLRGVYRIEAVRGVGLSETVQLAARK